MMIRLVGLEIPEQISSVGRRGDMSKKTMTKATRIRTFQAENRRTRFSANACEVTEQRHANPTFDRKETNESDTLHQERLRL